MLFENVNFNESFWKTKTLEEFIEHESHHGLSEDQLREAFAQIKPESEPKSFKESFEDYAEKAIEKKAKRSKG
jgi:membrane-bound lytic murein transglycosylase B